LGIAGAESAWRSRATGLPGAMKYDERWLGCGEGQSSLRLASGLVGGVLSAVLRASESVSDLAVELLREDRGRSGALYDSILVVWTS
jgi:hypothetical protein